MGDETLSKEEIDSLLSGADIISDDTGEFKQSSDEDDVTSYEEEGPGFDVTNDIVESSSGSDMLEAIESTPEVTKENIQSIPVEDVIVGKLTNRQEDNIELLLDIYVQVTVELGRTNIKVKDVLGLGEGSIIELNKPASEPVELLVNNRLVARGEVVVIDENFGARVTNIVAPTERVILEDH